MIKRGNPFGLGLWLALRRANAKNVVGLFAFIYNVCFVLRRVCTAESVRKRSYSNLALS